MENIEVNNYLKSAFDSLTIGEVLPVRLTNKLTLPDIRSIVDQYNIGKENTNSFIRLTERGQVVDLIRGYQKEEADIIETDYMKTVNMQTDEEIEQWESENFGCVVIDDMGRRMELQDAEWWSTDKNLKPTVPTGQHFLSIAACDDTCETELLLTFTEKDRVRKLRNFLNDYLEK